MEAFMEDYSEQIAVGIKTLLEKCLEPELLEQLQTSWGKHNPDRVDYRNGYRYRSLQTRLGLIYDLKAPRSREGIYQSKILPRYKRYEPGMEDLVRNSFFAGISTRRVGEVLEPLMGVLSVPALFPRSPKRWMTRFESTTSASCPMTWSTCSLMKCT
jgi:putative transposase